MSNNVSFISKTTRYTGEGVKTPYLGDKLFKGKLILISIPSVERIIYRAIDKPLV